MAVSNIGADKVQRLRKRSREDSHAALDRLLDAAEHVEDARGDAAGQVHIAADTMWDFGVIASELHVLSSVLFDHFSGQEAPEQVGTAEGWREATANLLRNYVPVPRHAAGHMATALVALNFGEIQELVRAKVTGRRSRAWAISMLQLAGVVHAYFLVGQGFRVAAAFQQVAEAYGYYENGANTVRSWGNRELKNLFGEPYLRCMKGFARNAGQYAHVENAPSSDHLEAFQTWHFAFDLRRSDLRRCGELYRASLNGEEVILPVWLQRVL